MPDPLQRVLLLLALSGMTEKEIHYAMRELDRLGPGSLAKMVHEARRNFRDIPPDFFGIGGRHMTYHMRDPDGTAAEEIARLLLNEAGLPTIVASEELRESLARSIPSSEKIPPFRPKEGFRVWVENLSRQFGSSLVLHHASKIRNSSVHIRDNDWPLRDREK